jgi:hypothetical protein
MRRGVKKLSAILIISVFLIAIASFALLRTKRSSSTEQTDYLPPGISSRGLFAEPSTSALGQTGGMHRNPSDVLADRLLKRAESGDLEVLNDARATRIDALYRRVLDALVRRSHDSADDLRSLADFIALSDGLRSSPALAARLLEIWEQEPARSSVTMLLRVAALSDDASMFERAVTTVLEVWETGRLRQVNAAMLGAFFESEYWLLSSEAKRSGAGFKLKQTLADARRRLSKDARRVNHPTDADFSDEVIAKKE